MLALCNINNDEKQGEIENFSMVQGHEEQFPDFSDDYLLDIIDFDDIFAGINEGDVLPDLEIDPEILSEFSTCSTIATTTTTAGGGSAEESEMINDNSGLIERVDHAVRKEELDVKELSVSDSSVDNTTCNFSSGKGDESVSKRKDNQSSKKAADKGRKPSCQPSKNPQGKRKFKVDWTPELHRKFVQAVEQLGIDKAVPSRILELMGIDCLTRHNVASHLQKYRSHRKHMLAREAEAASWNQKRQIYGAAGAVGKRDVNPWLAPTMGFPPVTPMHHLIRPLHVWGHPSVDQSLMHVWPKHLAHSPSPPPLHATPTWQPVAPAPPPDPSYWHPHHQRGPSTLALLAPCVPQPMAKSTRLTGRHVPGIPPHTMYKVEPGLGVPAGQSGPRPLLDLHPSKESVDAAIGDALSKPYLPLPIGLKPPAVDSVLVELQRQGVSKLPPNCA